MDNPATATIIGPNSQTMGKIEINVIPVDEDGESEVPEDMVPESPEDLINRRIDFIVSINRVFDLPADFCKDVFCEYTFYSSEEKFSTAPFEGKSREPIF